MAVVISDLHISNAGSIINGVIGDSKVASSYAEGTYYAVINLVNAAKKAKELNTYLVIAGDLMDNKRFLPQSSFTILLDAINGIRSTLVDVIIVIGNHDYEVYDREYSWLHGLFGSRMDSGIRVVPHGTVFYHDGVAYVSHHHDRDVLRTHVYDALSNEDILISHFGIDEAVLSSGYQVGGEFNASKEFSTYLDNKTVILGHYHKPQSLKFGHVDVHYIGSPVPTRIDEWMDDKRFLAFFVNEVGNVEIQSFETVYRKWVEIKYNTLEEVNDVGITYLEQMINENKRILLKLAVPLSGKLREFVYSHQDSFYVKYSISDSSSIDRNTMNLVGSDGTFVDAMQSYSFSDMLYQYCISSIGDSDQTLLNRTKEIIEEISNEFVGATNR